MSDFKGWCRAMELIYSSLCYSGQVYIGMTTESEISWFKKTTRKAHQKINMKVYAFIMSGIMSSLTLSKRNPCDFAGK